MNDAFKKILDKYGDVKPLEPSSQDCLLEFIELAQCWPDVFRVVADESQPFAWVTYALGTMQAMPYVEKLYAAAYACMTDAGVVARLARLAREIEAIHGPLRVLPQGRSPRVNSSSTGRGMKMEKMAGKSESCGTLLDACRK